MITTRPTHLSLVALAAALTLSAPSRAQTYVVQTGVDSQHFRPTPGTHDILGIQSATLARHLGGRAGLYFNLSQGSGRLAATNTGQNFRLVDHKLGLDVLGSIGLFEWLEVGAVIPATLYQDGDRDSLYVLDTGGDVDGAGIGDIRLVPKVRLLGRDFPVQLALAVDLAFPTGDHKRFMGHDGVGFAPSLLVGGTFSFGLTLEGNVGVRYRPSKPVMNVIAGPDVSFGLGARQPFDLPAGHEIAVLASLTGQAAIEGPIDTGIGAEVLGAVEYRPFPALAITAGAGAGFGIGLGPPEWRVLLGADYRWGLDTVAGPACLHGPEDMDGFQDGDACADPDNDEDGVLDADDVCPFVPETLNDWRDEDGCPDERPPGGDYFTDADRRGGPMDPNADTDGDGLLDGEDVCADRAEDMDGFEDSDGCPDVDNDKDGVLDTDDTCPLEAEVVNGVDDDDGCPDEGESKVKVTRERIVIREKIYFDTAEATIGKRSYPLLDQVMAVLRAHTQITLVVIEGHTDSVSDTAYNHELSKRRASAVRDYLIQRGLEASRLEARGYGETRPIGDNETAEGREKNRRVELHVAEVDGEPVERGEPVETTRDAPADKETP